MTNARKGKFFLKSSLKWMCHILSVRYEIHMIFKFHFHQTFKCSHSKKKKKKVMWCSVVIVN